ncbi:MAG TPA: CHRD domain-containing protein [Acidobacteriota bacterium]|nr:CHRD domain-containing protein [Acidobacteriota bacterium]
MKERGNMLKKGFYLAICALFMASMVIAQPVSFDLTGDQEVPPVDTEFSGSCTGNLDALQTAFSIDCTHDVDNATAAHIHRGAEGVNGPIVFFLNADTTFSFTVTAETLQQQADDMLPVAGISFEEFLDALRTGNLYVNVHTMANVGGEIRGQIPPTGQSLYFAQFGSGLGDPMLNTPTISSQITLLNSSATPASGTVSFFDDAGMPADVTVGDTMASEFPFTLNGNGTFQLDLVPTETFVVGSAVLNADQSVIGFLRFAIEGSGIASVLGQGAGTSLVAPVTVSETLNTGVALQNAETSMITVNCELRDDTGAAVAMTGVPLDGRGHFSQFVTELFDSVDFSTGFQGSIACSSDSGFAMIALEQGPADSGLLNAVPSVPN